MGFDPCLHSGVFLHRLGLAAKILDMLPILHDHLVAAASKGKVDGNTGIFGIFNIRTGIITDTDTDGHCHFIADIDRLQDIKALLFQLFQRFSPHDKKVFVLLQPPEHTVKPAEILIHLTFYQRSQQRTAHRLDALHDLLIIIQIKKSGNHRLVFTFADVLIQLCLVEQVQNLNITAFHL